MAGEKWNEERVPSPAELEAASRGVRVPVGTDYEDVVVIEDGMCYRFSELAYARGEAPTCLVCGESRDGEVYVCTYYTTGMGDDAEPDFSGEYQDLACWRDGLNADDYPGEVYIRAGA